MDKVTEANRGDHVGYHVSGSVDTHGGQEGAGTKEFKVKFADHPSKEDIAKQNKHLKPHEVDAVHQHINDHADDDMTDTHSEQKAGGKMHDVGIHSNKPVFKAKTNENTNMNENTQNLISAIASGDTIASSAALSTALFGKIAEKMDARRKEIAKTMFKESTDLDEDVTTHEAAYKKHMDAIDTIVGSTKSELTHDQVTKIAHHNKEASKHIDLARAAKRAKIKESVEELDEAIIQDVVSKQHTDDAAEHKASGDKMNYHNSMQLHHKRQQSLYRDKSSESGGQLTTRGSTAKKAADAHSD